MGLCFGKSDRPQASFGLSAEQQAPPGSVENGTLWARGGHPLGATCVGSIITKIQPGDTIGKGEELGHFRFGEVV